MAMSTNMKIGLGVGAGALLLWALTGKSDKTHAKNVYVPGDDITVFQGVPFRIRLPRGEYQSLNAELQVASQADYGTVTDVEVLALAAPTDYTIQAVLSNVDKPTSQFPFTVSAKKPV